MAVEAYLTDAVHDHFFIPFFSNRIAQCCAQMTCHTFLENVKSGFAKRFPEMVLDEKQLLEIYTKGGIEGYMRLYFLHAVEIKNEEEKSEHFDSITTAVNRAALRHLGMCFEEERMRDEVLKTFDAVAQEAFLYFAIKAIEKYHPKPEALPAILETISKNFLAPLFPNTKSQIEDYLRSHQKEEKLPA